MINIMGKKLIFFVMFLSLLPLVSANINLEFRTDSNTARTGDVVNVRFYAVSDTNENQLLGAMDVIFGWGSRC